MIGKSTWFGRRKYLGWGIMPKTWQGWVYLIVILLPIMGITYVPGIDERVQTILLVIWSAIFIVDFIDIMMHLKNDEREKMHEAYAERNALWVILATLVIGVGYQASQRLVKDGTLGIDPVILIAIVAGLIAKAATNIYLDRHD